MSLFSYLTKMEDMAGKQNAVLPSSTKGKNKAFVNHVQWGGSEYQLMFVFGGGYSEQSVYYRRQKDGKEYIPIATNIRILEEDMLSLASVFSKKGINGIKYMLGVL